MASLLTVQPISAISSPVQAERGHSVLLPPLALSGGSEPPAGGRVEELAQRLALFTLLTGVLLSSPMISAAITSAPHSADSSALSLRSDIMEGMQKKRFV